MKRKLIAIVPAAGVGARARPSMDGPVPARPDLPKQYQPIRGRPMLRLAVQALLADPRVDQVRVAVAAGDAQVAHALDGLPRTVWRECGGPTRALTVAGALADASLADDDWVLVHDAARPGLPADALARLITTCLEAGRGGLLAMPVADTVKRAIPSDGVATPGPDEGGLATAANVPAVLTSVARDGLWLAQTPQMFPAGPLARALQRALDAGHAITDEASAMELAGYAPLLVNGSMRNFKVTWPDDITLMELLME
ncbi:MAG TPA: 2-C-methyl-D-erythritol 4-phosphate cytidylyltransferase [Burkholderiaceae bacterium]|nr:2-C-methyl-D-erythritol 4-phosphate cytidylyltransferase [Burkholderiaceae bacterium]